MTYFTFDAEKDDVVFESIRVEANGFSIKIAFIDIKHVSIRDSFIEIILKNEDRHYFSSPNIFLKSKKE